MFQSVVSKWRSLLKSRKGQGLTEYAVILGIVVVIAATINSFHYGAPTHDSKGQPGQHFGLKGEVHSLYNRISERIIALSYELRGDHVAAGGSNTQQGNGGK